MSAAYIYNPLRLLWRAPDITAAIVNGRQPQQLNAMTLMRQASRLPAEWSEQRTQLGFQQEGPCLLMTQHGHHSVNFSVLCTTPEGLC